ncbi:predicted GPI-anchored protein 1 [[Candida] anglica]|uniref:Predicted GPI-anchored protein 1 n=1 Tax=[Candida] anglica TaxID=148631 RepID=A0ABP0EIS8_9ASCO
MKIISCFFSVFTFLSCVAALAMQQDEGDTTTNTSLEPTTVWVTITTDGKLATVKTLYKQSFGPSYSDPITTDLKSGNIGLGAISGTVGDFKTYQQTTVKNGQNSLTMTNIYAGLAGISFLVIGALV